MRNRISQRGTTKWGESFYITQSGKQTVLKERMQQGDCTYCPANHNGNANGSKSIWGRKVAKKREYATGKGRNERYLTKSRLHDISYDKHYDKEREKQVKKQSQFPDVSRGEFLDAIESVGKYLIVNKGKITTSEYPKLTKYPRYFGLETDTLKFSIGISRKKPESETPEV